MASGPITSWPTDGETVETVSDFIFLGSKITADGDCSHEIKRCLLLGRKVMTNLVMTNLEIYDQSKHYFVNKDPSNQGYGFSSGHLWMTQSWTVKKAKHRRMDAFEIVMLEKTLESPLDCKEIQPVHPKDQSWVFIERTDAEAEISTLWPPHAKS